MQSWFAVLLVGGLVLPRAASAQSVDGDWDAAMSTPGGTVTFGITFTQHGDTLAGTVHRSAGDAPLSGTINGDTVTFGYVVQYNGHDLNLTMTARLVRDSLTGTVDFDGQGEDRFWASRSRPHGGAPPRDAATVIGLMPAAAKPELRHRLGSRPSRLARDARYIQPGSDPRT